MWTAFDYMYRDAGNFKAFGTITLKGRLSKADRQAVQDRLDRGEFFVAEQVGVPSLYEELYRWTDGPTASDHCWHEFIGFRKLVSAPAQHSRIVDASTFAARFMGVDEWNGSLSPHFKVG